MLTSTTGLKLHQQKKSTGRSESSSDTTMTSPVTKKNFKIGPLGDFEKSAFLYFHPSQYNLTPGIKGATDQMLPWKAPTDLKILPMGILHEYNIYVVLDHPWAIRVPTGAPKWPKTVPKWPRMAQNYQNGSKRHCMTPNGPKTLPMGILHDYMPWSTTLGPFQRPTGAP